LDGSSVSAKASEALLTVKPFGLGTSARTTAVEGERVASVADWTTAMNRAKKAECSDWR